jgi:hypothetical protein
VDDARLGFFWIKSRCHGSDLWVKTLLVSAGLFCASIACRRETTCASRWIPS